MKEGVASLSEIEVIGDLNSPFHTTQTGKVSLTSEQLNAEFSLLSSPDLVKTLQTIPGVSAGTELLSGMYVKTMRIFFCLTEHPFIKLTIWEVCFRPLIRILSRM